MIREMFIIAALAGLAGESGAALADCKASDFSAVVDQSGASLRAFTLQEQPKVQEKMRRYKEVRRLSEEEYQDVAFEVIQDAKLVELDQTSGDLLLKVDTLGRVPEGTAPDCSKLDEIKAASNTLLSVMKAKSDYILQRLDAKIAEASAQSPPAKPATPPEKTQAEAAKPPPDSAKQQTALAAPPVTTPKPPQPKPANPSEWSPKTKQNDAYSPSAAPEAPKVAAVEPQPAPSESEGYTIDEIREATRGFFGGLSTNLASVIEHAFKESGRPSAYVLGTEGGGAFLAGLRFGEGTLFMRERQQSLPVFWHGPSLGSDFGASGSRTLFLIYHLRDAEALFRNFAGVDGSAYVVGGVGLTVLKGGDVIMAPIRTGLGLRVGANVGYIRFTRKATWNPF